MKDVPLIVNNTGIRNIVYPGHAIGEQIRDNDKTDEMN